MKTDTRYYRCSLTYKIANLTNIPNKFHIYMNVIVKLVLMSVTIILVGTFLMFSIEQKTQILRSNL